MAPERKHGQAYFVTLEQGGTEGPFGSGHLDMNTQGATVGCDEGQSQNKCPSCVQCVIFLLNNSWV